ncbi:1963_t:CDS:2, partial [Paraglomus occultum]
MAIFVPYSQDPSFDCCSACFTIRRSTIISVKARGDRDIMIIDRGENVIGIINTIPDKGITVNGIRRPPSERLMNSLVDTLSLSDRLVEGDVVNEFFIGFAEGDSSMKVADNLHAPRLNRERLHPGRAYETLSSLCTPSQFGVRVIRLFFGRSYVQALFGGAAAMADAVVVYFFSAIMETQRHGKEEEASMESGQQDRIIRIGLKET